MSEKQYFTWTEFDLAIEDIVHKLSTMKLIDRIDGIYGIPRGGLVVAVALSHLLDKPLITSFSKAFWSNEHILLVDDISDTGHTLSRYSKAISKLTATIHIGTDTSYKPTVYHTVKRKGWIVYPWERDEREDN